MEMQNENPIVVIGDTNIPVIEYRGKRVVTFAMVDQVHQRTEGTARKRFNDHKDKFIDEEDFYRMTHQEVTSLSEFRTAGIQANSQGMIVLTECGYLMLVKSFTDNLAWKVQRALVNRYFQPPPKSNAHELLRSVQLLVEHEERMHRLEIKHASQQEQLEAISKRQAGMDGNTGYMTALAFCRKEGVPAPLSFAQRLGHKATDMYRNLGICTGRIPDERWGAVNSYPVEILQECHMTMGKE